MSSVSSCPLPDTSTSEGVSDKLLSVPQTKHEKENDTIRAIVSKEILSINQTERPSELLKKEGTGLSLQGLKVGLSSRELKKVEKEIDRIFKLKIEENFSLEKDGHRFEYISEKRALFVLFEKKPTTIIGHGQRKTYTYGLECKKNRVCVVATTSDCLPLEIQILKELQASRGISELLAVKESVHSKKKQLVIQKFYNLGSLDELIRKNCLQKEEKESIVLSLLEGMKSLKKAKIVHGDLHAGQFLVERLSDGSVHAVIADFDASEKKSEALCDEELSVCAEVFRELFFKDDEQKDWVFSLSANAMREDVKRKIQKDACFLETLSYEEALWYYIVQMAYSKEEGITASDAFESLKKLFATKQMCV